MPAVDMEFRGPGQQGTQPGQFLPVPPDREYFQFLAHDVCLNGF
jgi:hypothetical protein